MIDFERVRIFGLGELILFRFDIFRLDAGAWNDVFIGGPIAQVDKAAAVAAKRHIRVIKSHGLTTDRTTDRAGHTSII